jgi:hypothetical protein
MPATPRRQGKRYGYSEPDSDRSLMWLSWSEGFAICTSCLRCMPNLIIPQHKLKLTLEPSSAHRLKEVI